METGFRTRSWSNKKIEPEFGQCADNHHEHDEHDHTHEAAPRGGTITDPGNPMTLAMSLMNPRRSGAA
ncbi:hypothetical protein MESS4_830279 [Mesorhizobium sp. STM 4661]|nr:hypothetical protein MESS4_830279 [Mesorhizobium sp. STM 4661]